MKDATAVTVSRGLSGYVVALSGRGTCEESLAVRDFAMGAMNEGEDVVVSVVDCEYLDSTFLGCLAVLSKRGRKLGDRFHVHANDPIRSQFFYPARLDRVLPFCEDLPTTQGAVPLEAEERQVDSFGRHLLETHEELANLGGPDAAAFRRVASRLRDELDGEQN